MVLLYARICIDAPVLLLGVVDSRAPFADVLTDDMESTLDRLEMLIVDALVPVRDGATGSQPRKQHRAGGQL